MRAYTHRFITLAIQCSIILLLAFGLSISADHSLAQDAATETPVPADTATVAPTDAPTEVPTIVPTDVPTEIPTDVPTAAPTEQATVEATEAVTEQPSAAPTDAATAAPTDSATLPPATQASPDVFTEDFQNGAAAGWLLTPGWTVTDESGNKILASSTTNDVATLTGIMWPYFTLSFRVRGNLQLNVASGGSSYQVKLSADGAAALYKDSVLVGQSAGLPATDATVEPSINWHTVNLLAPGNILAVKVDNFTPISISDPSLLGMGPIIFSTSAENTTSAAIDDLHIQRLDAPPPLPTVEPTTAVPPSPIATLTTEPTVEATTEPTQEATSEATVESTLEATTEATVEVTQEATLEATSEATAEATTEATAEATIEATAEATVEPLTLSDAARQKLPPELVDMLDKFQSGDVVGANDAAAASFITLDDQQRLNVTVWTTDDQAAAKIVGDITDANGVITDALNIRLQALVTLETLTALANAPEVTMIELPARAVSTSNLTKTSPSNAALATTWNNGIGSGSILSEAVDTTGAAAWQNAGVKGAGVGIAVMDTEFGSPSQAPTSAVGDYACLGSTSLLSTSQRISTDKNHGLYMVQVLCDMAPASKVYMYKATDAGTLAAEVLSAKNNANIKVIVIAMDLGVYAGPGDGTGGGANFSNPLYKNISDARAAGKVVIASAGNNGCLSGIPSLCHYVTINFNAGTVNIPANIYAGDIINVSWNDWAGTLHGPTPEDFTSQFDNNANFYTGTRGAATNAPRFQHTILPSECNNSVDGCSVTLKLTGKASNNPGTIVVQVQITGNSTLDPTAITGGGSPATGTGTLARPADSQDVIAVGAVCPDGPPINVNLDGLSSTGPIFALGGDVQVVNAPFTQNQVKPDLTSLTHVSVSLALAQNQGNCDITTGFNGTSAAAANVAGMAALLISNTNSTMSAFDGTTSAAVDALQNYMQTHTMDNITTSGFAVGYDMSYGAGLTVLGSPTYDLSQVVTPSSDPNQIPLSCTGVVYVGSANPTSAQLGTRTAPYISLNEAISKSTAGQCVIVLPGEYVAQLYTDLSTATTMIMSYDAATSTVSAPSVLWSVNSAPIFIQTNNLVIDGFTVKSAFTVTYTKDDGTTTSLTPPAIRSRSASGEILQNNTFSDFRAPGTLRGPNIQVLNNTFSNFIIPLGPTLNITQPASDTAVLKFEDASNFVFSYNTLQNNYIPGTTDPLNPIYLPSILGLKNSTGDVFGNRFVDNKINVGNPVPDDPSLTSAIMGVNEWTTTRGSTKNTGEVRIFSNVFSGNSNHGPIVHFYQAPNMRFINNTVVKNKTNPTDFHYDGYLVYGTSAMTNGAEIGDRRLEIHNNLFYNNGDYNISGKNGNILVLNAGIGTGCESITGGTPVRNNWFSPPLLAVASKNNDTAGECVDLPVSPFTIKSTGTINENIPDTDATPVMFFGAAADPVDPYRLRPNNNNALKGGINTGDMPALTSMFGLDLTIVKDLLQGQRVLIGQNANPTYFNQLLVDIGAYELTVPTPPVANNISQQINEDSTTSIVFKLTATGGYSRLFKITAPPTNYDTSPTNACGGQPVVFTSPNIVTYCPPANFHTFYGSGGSDVPVTIGFSVVDNVGNPGVVSNGTISLTINPVNDGDPNQASPDLDFNLISDYITPISQQLVPSYQINNFALSATGTDVDFPYTYTFDAAGSNNNPNLLGPSTVSVLQAAFTAANTNGGRLIINPVAGQQGFYSFSYKIADRDGAFVIGHITLVILPTLAKEGVYDDASFNFNYNGTGWTPSFVTGAYNNTLHSTLASGDTVEIPFAGSSVRFNLRGSAAGTTVTNTLKMAFKLNIATGTATFQDYNTTKTALGSGFSCINSLTSTAPDSSSNTKKYSATSSAFTIFCSGFPIGQVHSIQLTNNLANAAMTLDSAEVSAGILTAGKSYPETSANFTYTGVWTQTASALALGGTFRTTKDPNGKVSFNVDSSVGRLVIYRTTGAATTYGSTEVYVGGVLTATISNVSTSVLYAQPYLLTLTPGNQTVELRNVGSKSSTIDQIDALPIVQSLTAGTYQENYNDLTYLGVWTTLISAAPLGGSVRYTKVANASMKFKVDSTVGRVTIYRTTASTYGSTQIYVDGATTPLATMNNKSTATLYGQPYTFTLTPGNHTIELRNVGVTYSSIDQITLQGPAQALTTTTNLGGIYEENEPNFTFTGTWVQAINGAAFAGAWRYTTEAGASLTFSIDSSVTRIFIYRATGSGFGSMQVFLDGSITPIATISNSGSGTIFQQPVSVNIVTPGSHTITIKNVAATNSNIDRILLLGDSTPLSTTPGTYQEDNTNLNYSGTWLQGTNALALGNPAKYRYTTVKDAYVTFPIDTTIATRMVIYRTTGPGYGSMDVTINGAFVVNISNVSGTVLYGQPFVVDIPALTPGIYPVKINNKAATNSSIDQITMLGAPAALTTAPGTYQESNPNLTYTGSWIQLTNAAAFSNGYRYTTAVNATVKFNIDNSVKRIVIYRTTGSGYGSMDVLDSGSVTPTTPIATIVNSGALLYGQPVIITLTTTGTRTITLKNKTALNSNIDQIVLLGNPVALTTSPGSYQEMDPNFTYTGKWTLGTNALALGNGKWRYTTEKDASVKFDIDSSVKRMILYRTIGSGYGSVDVTDQNSALIATIPNANTTLLYGQPFLVNIPSGTTAITIKNKAATNSSIDQIDLLGDPTPLGVGSYQENDTNFTYSNNWLVGTNTLALSGQWRYTTTAGATMSFPVDTANVSRMIIYRTIGSGYGSMDVLLDNNTTPTATITNANSTLLYGQPFPVNIPPGTTKITIKNNAKTNSSIDQIDLLSGTSPLTNNPGIYQENDPNFTYTGTWLQGKNTLALAGGWRYTTALDASVSLRVDITNVTRMVVYRTIGVGYGSMDVTDENSAHVATINNTNATLQYGQPFVIDISALGLSVGTHIFTFKNTTTKNVSIDQIVLLGDNEALSTTTGLAGVHQETEPNFIYSGLWTQTTNASAIGSAWTFTNQAGANLTFTIDSSVSRVVLYRTTNKIGYGSLQVFLDGAVTPLTTISNVDSALLFGQPIVINIPTPGSHILVLKNVGASNSNIDQITLLGPSTALAAPNTLQETDFNLTYTGVWTQTQTPTAFSGARRYTKQKDAAVSFSVDNTVSRIVIFRTTGPASTYGSLQVFDGNTLLATISNVGKTVMYAQPFFLDVTPTGHTITLKNVAATQSDIDQIVLLGTAASTPLSTAQVYEETDPAFAYTGLWARATGTGPSGNAAYYTYTPGASVTFKFTGRAFSIYRMLASGGGTFTVKIDNGTAQSFSTKSTTTLWQQTLDFGPLTNTLHTVVITNTSTAANFIYFDAIRIIDTTVPLTAGEYQNTYPSLTYSGAWAVDDAVAGLSLGAGTVTTTPGDQLTFNFVGTGFGIMTDNVPTGANMQICYTISAGVPVCNSTNNGNDYSTVANPKQLNVGYAFYGLKQGSYTVTVKHMGTVGQGLYIDRIFVLDTPPTVLQPNLTYENTAADIVYSPSSLWTTQNSSSASGRSTRVTSQKGAVMQVRFNGGTMFLYQSASTTAAKSINLCVLLTDSAGTPTSLCTTFSQKSTTAKFIAPVAFYGFGNGTHEVIFENQTQGSQFNVDKILVQ